MALNKVIFDIFGLNVPTKLDKILVLSIMTLSIKFDTLQASLKASAQGTEL